MKVNNIHYNDSFEKQFLAIPKIIQKKAIKKELIFRENPFHPSLGLYKLNGNLDGLWSISIDMKYRIIFKPLADGVILFISVGVHSIYEGK
jgi:mRNA-degrading endonuclease YafQ of YafQ-DinJ toxin-antitoxin module